MKKKVIQAIIAFVLVLTLACGLIPNPRLSPDGTLISPSLTASLEFPDLFPSEAPTPISTTIPTKSETIQISTEFTNSSGKAIVKNASPTVDLSVEIKDNLLNQPLKEIQVQVFLVDNKTKVLIVALDPKGEYFTLIQLVNNPRSQQDGISRMMSVPSVKAQNGIELALIMVKIVEWWNTGKSAFEYFRNMPEIRNLAHWHADYCFSGEQLASYFGFTSGVATLLIPSESTVLEEELLNAIFDVSTHIISDNSEDYLRSLPDKYLIRIHYFPRPNFSNTNSLALSLVGFEYLGNCDTLMTTTTPIFTDGGKIVFDSPVGGNWQVFAINPDGSNLRQLTNISQGIGDPAISPDGKLIVFVGDDAKSLYVMNADGTQIRNIYQNPKEVGWPAWSFDSQKIVFASEVNGYKNLFMMRSDGTNVEQLTNVLANDLAPSFSPDRSQIIFSSTRSGTWDIYKLSLFDKEVVRLTNLNDPNGQGWPSWSPDNSRIVFESVGNSNSRDVFIMRSDGTEVTNITNSPKYEGAPVWSPDSTRIAFASDRDGSLDIYIMQSDGSGITRLTTIWAWGPSWSFQKSSK